MHEAYQRFGEAAGTAELVSEPVAGEVGVGPTANGECEDQVDSATSRNAIESLDGVIARTLPLNRKERFYTGTVLPMIVASDGFVHLHRFLSLCGLPADTFKQNSLDDLAAIEFFSEYNFAESRFTAEDIKRFPEAPADGETPDLVIVGEGWLLAVEAKVFHSPAPAALNDQMRRQRLLVDYWAQCLEIPSDRVAHVLLLPSGLSTPGVTHKVVTWEAVLDSYRAVGPAYWIAMLGTALIRYPHLRSRRSGGQNADGRMTGADIFDGFGGGKLKYAYMGRTGGRNGSAMLDDLNTGGWRSHSYEVRRNPLPGASNWFAIADFITQTASSDLES